MTFEILGLDRPILNTLAAKGYARPTPIQTKAIPVILEGRDVVGLAQTGTGKTAAFTLPLLQRLVGAKRNSKFRPVRVLILSPTRELAAQIHKAVRDYGHTLPLRSVCITGGVAIGPQRKALSSGADIVIATPGRLIDLHEQNALQLDRVETLVLDEADHMLDIGFMPAVRRIMALMPNERQTLLFSATMPKEIRDLSASHLRQPVEISVAPAAKTADRIAQSVMHLHHGDKMRAVADMVRQNTGKRIIVFTRTKRGADRVVQQLNAVSLSAAAIHGNKSQGQRERALAAFRDGSCPVLIATDIAARGIDIPDVGLVINYELPDVPEVYVHRIGRTARAGAEGLAVSLCSGAERGALRDIEKLIRLQIPLAIGANGEVTAAPIDEPTPAGQRSGKPRGKKPVGAKKPANGVNRDGVAKPASGHHSAKSKPGRGHQPKRDTAGAGAFQTRRRFAKGGKPNKAAANAG